MSGDVGFGSADEPCEAQIVGGCSLRLATEPGHRGAERSKLTERYLRWVLRERSRISESLSVNSSEVQRISTARLS
jgi:hypothetical protein